MQCHGTESHVFLALWHVGLLSNSFPLIHSASLGESGVPEPPCQGEPVRYCVEAIEELQGSFT